MKKTWSVLYLIFSSVILIDILIEYFFAHPTVFHASVRQIHMTTGDIAQYASILLLLLALLGRVGRNTVGLSALLMALFFFQPVLTAISAPIMIHAIVGILSLILNACLVVLGITRLANKSRN